MTETTLDGNPSYWNPSQCYNSRKCCSTRQAELTLMKKKHFTRCVTCYMLTANHKVSFSTQAARALYKALPSCHSKLSCPSRNGMNSSYLEST